ncbi:hypothetical protein GGF31_006118 [Allomyces arbusculus]|nr:hypothetical protein GGF31_006118 [Allomyces arbusculus]
MSSTTSSTAPAATNPAPAASAGSSTGADPYSDRHGHPAAHLLEPEERPVHDEHHLTEKAASTSTLAGGRTVLVPVDGSPSSIEAVEWARHHFLRPNDTVVLVHVRSYQNLYLADMGASLLPAVEDLEDAARRDSHALIRDMGRRLLAPLEGTNAPPVTRVRGFAIRGDARADILRKARDVHADAIVVGSRGLGMLKRAVLGSVSDYLSHHAPCPVLVIRPVTTHDEEHLEASP